jgi:hypothetical protein
MPKLGLTLRDRLHVLRADALARMAAGKQIDGGLLTLAAHASDVLAELDAEGDVTVTPEPAGRAVVQDNGLQITVVLFSPDRRAAAVALSPTAAIRLGNHLVAAGVRRL